MSWTIWRTAKEFGATFHVARMAQQLQKEKGCLSDPNPKTGKSMSKETADQVR